MSKKIGAILARLTPIEKGIYRIDFSMHENDYDSDDEGDEWQWRYPIRFTHEGGLFLNTEIQYDTRERHTATIFWKDSSTSIIKMITDTLKVWKASGESVPDWPISKMCNAGDAVWFKHISKRK
jgi:hypothetical protein